MNDKLTKLTVGLLVLALVFGLMVLFAKANKAGPAGVRNEMTNLAVGFAHYHAVFGNFPTGNNAQVTSALHGSNPRKVVIDPMGPRRMNKGDELRDIWDTPYRFNFASNSTIAVSSAGKNGSFGDEDDLVVCVSLDDTKFPFWTAPPQFTNTLPQE